MSATAAPATPASAAPAAPGPSANPFASASLYVGDLSPEVNESMLYEYFNSVGPVASVRVCRDALTRRSLGYAYVNFHDVRDAERALDTMNFTPVGSRNCRIMWSQRDPSLRRSGAGNIYVKNLDPTIDSKTLYDTFSVFGNILSCKVVTNSRFESLGYGFVHFETEETAKSAIATVNGKMLAGKVVAVQPFKSRKERDTTSKKYTNIYVKNLPSDATQIGLDQYFGQFGKVTSVFMPMDEKNNRPRGFGFINFETHEQAANAVEKAHEQELSGNKLYVAKAQKKSERERELRSRFELMRVERQNRYNGVNLYVKNLSDTMTDQRMIDEFKKYGNITSARLMNDVNGRSRQFGFVCFSNSDEATKAVTEMNGKMLDNKPLYVALAQPREVRRAALEARFSRKMPFIQPGMYPQGPPFFFGPQMPHRMVFQPNVARAPVNRQWPQQPPQGRGNPQMMGVPYNSYGMGPRPMARGRGGPRLQNMNKPMRPNVNPGPNPAAPVQPRPARGANPRMNRNGPNVPMAPVPGPQPLTVSELAQLSDQMQKKAIGDRLFPLIQAREPEKAPKITGMLLDMDNGELLHLLESQEALGEKINEALQVLHEAEETTE